MYGDLLAVGLFAALLLVSYVFVRGLVALVDTLEGEDPPRGDK